MIDKLIQYAIGAIAGVIIGATVVAVACATYELYVEYVDKKKAAEIIKQNVLNTVKAIVEEDDASHISIACFDENQERIGNLKINANRVANDIKKGDIIYV